MNKFKKIDSKDIEDIIALTPMQEGMLFHYLREPRSDFYFQQLSLETSGEIDVEYFEKSWNLVIETNEMLRTVFRWEKLEHPIQIILKKHNIHPRYINFSKQETGEKKKHIEEIRIKDRKEKFDLREVPFRITLCRIDNSKYEMIISNHHILYDGWSNGIILKEFFNAYNDLYKGKESIGPVKTKFEKFVKWSQSLVLDTGNQEKYWRNYLKGFDNKIELSVKRRRTGETASTKNYRTNLPKDLKDEVEDFVKKRKITSAALLYSTWGLLLQKYNNNGDVIFGTTAAGRSAKIQGIEDMIGLFINTIPFRVQTDYNEKIGHWLYRINNSLKTREVYENSSLPKIKEYIELKGNEALFDSIVVIENYPLDTGIIPGDSPISLTSYSMFEAAHYDLTVCISTFADIEFNFIYNRELFAGDQIERLCRHFVLLLERIVKNPEEEVNKIEVISEEEKHRILYDFNDTDSGYPGDKTIHQLFDEQAARNQDKIAAIAPGTVCSTLSYRQLNKESDQLTALLIEKGLNPGDIAAIMLDRSIEMVIAIIAILKAGGAYLPIDPHYPEERKHYILRDSSARILLTGQGLPGEAEKVSKWEGEAIFLDARFKVGVKEKKKITLPRHHPQTIDNAGSTAYVIYTSGSTGRPKGVIVEHRPAVNILIALQREYPIREYDTYLLKTSYVFDVSVAELFGWFLGGGRLAILEKGGEKDPKKIIDTIESAAVTHINFVPSMFNAFADELKIEDISKISSLKYIFLAGEALPPELVNKFRSLNTKIALENIYGPTEGTVYSSRYSLSDWSGSGSIPIGRSMQNIKLYILDKDNHLQPISVPGELCIAGQGLARGYLNNPGLTVERFISFNSYRSYTSYISKKIYKTGDLARWLPDGNIEFLGRIDHQVKVRGFRIELGEIENQLLKYGHIKETVVTTNEDKNGDKYLCAYIVPHSPHHIETSHLQNHLAQKLPDYMIPAFYVQLEQIPLTPTGKIDRKALPKPGIKPGIQYTAPRDKIEKQLVEIWSGVLGIQREKIGIDYNFFKLGGHSLKAVRLLARIHKKLDVEIPLDRMFETPTIRGLTHCTLELRKTPLAAIEPAEEKEYYELSPSQKRFFVFWQWRPGDFSHNVSEIMVIEGPVSREKFAGVFKQLIDRHESLRTSFHLVDGEPVQRIHDEVEFRIEYDTVPEHTGSHHSSKNRIIRHSFIRPFDLSRAPLVRLGFAKIQGEKYFLMFDMHHIVSDGVSTGIFIKEFLALHAGEQLPPLRIQYKDYVEWEKKKKKKKKALPQAKYRQTALNLPLDFPRPAVPDFKGNTIKFEIDGPERVSDLLSLQEDITLFMVLLAAFNVFLSKISGQENIIVGSPIAGRQHPDLEGMIGLLINPLALQNFPKAHKRFFDFLTEVKKNVLEAFANQDDQYDEMVEQVISGRNTSHNPLYDVMFVLQNMEIPGIEIPGLKVTRQVGDNPTAKFDMTLYYEDFFSSFKLEYAAALFKPETIRRFIGYFKKVVGQILENPHQTIAEIEMIPREEKQRILYDFNDTVVEYPYDQCIYQLIANQAQRIPDSLAVIQSQPDESSGLPFILTYRQLNAKSNRLARLLRKRGIKTNTVVGIMMKRSPAMLMGILGILKAGGVYLPVDSQYPENRINNMLENSHASFLLTNRAIVEEKSLPFPAQQREVEIILMDELGEEWEKEPGKNLKPLSTPNDLIYIIFTSGSTGIPKGAGVYHRGFVNLLHWFVAEFGLNYHDRNLLLTSLSFDLTQKNFYAPLISGGQFCIPGFSYFEPRSLLRLIQEHRVTWINCTPGMFYKLVEYKRMNEDKRLSSLRYVFLGGEPISIPPIIDWLESEDCRAEIVNTYGPTECTDISNFYRIKQPRKFLEQAVPIGQPVYNVQLYIPDKNLRLLPVGTAGELYIGGAGVGIGYINDEQLTNQKFIKRSFDPNQPEQLLYRTGDLVKWLPDGNIEFLGRIDHQVKVRGFRIELGEIENQLLLHPTVKETLVMAREDEASEKYLCAYIVPDSTDLNTAELREYLSRELPGYMVPAYFMVLEKMPLNPNGKVDRKALPEPDSTSKDNYVPPQSDTENRLAEIWAEVLGLDKNQVGIHDNFFISGGHSLKATTLIGKIYKAFCVEIPIAEIFKQPTVKNISRYLEQSKESLYLSIAPLEKKDYYPLSSAQKRLFVIEQMDPGNVTYNIPAVLKLEGKLDRSCFAGSFRKLIARHESLRTSFQLIAGEPVQKVHDDVEFEIEYFLATEDTEDTEKRNYKLQITNKKETESHHSFIRPFDLSHVPLLRVGLIKIEEKNHLLMFDMHHIISDGISMEIFMREFAAFYQGEVIPGLRVQYKDFSHWQNALIDSGAIKQQESYWLEIFAGEIPVLNLPCDFPRPALQTHEGNSLEFKINPGQTQQLKQLTMKSETTAFIVLLAVFNLLLSKLSGREDIVVGSPAAGRRHPDLESLIGVFINTLALRNYPAADRPFDEFLAQVKKNSLDAYENQDYQYEELVEKVQPRRDLSRSPLFDVMLVVPNMEMEFLDIPGIALTPVEYPRRTSKFDMIVTAVEKDHRLDFTITYSTALFTEETIRRFINYFKRILAAVLKDIKQKITGIDILADDEKKQLLYGFNLTEKSYSMDKTIHRLFEEQVEQTPDHIVLKGNEAGWKGRSAAGKKEEGHLSYRELNERANQLGRFLRRKGITRETITGIMMDPSLDMMIGILAVLKAGGAYLPIDPRQQAGRVAYMLNDSRAVLLLTRGHLVHAPGFGVPSLAIDRAALYKGERNNPERKTSPADVVYTIYTSGTTGKSKGTLIENKNLVNYVYWFREKVHLTGRDRAVLTSSFSFDLGYTAIYPSILTGCQLHIIPGETFLAPGDLICYINQHGITYIKVTPSLFTTIVESSGFSQTACPGLRLVVLGGEEIKLKDVGKAHRIAKHLHFMNHYGPTEATIGCVARFIDFNRFADYKKRPTIGAPIDNMKAVILDNGLMMVPVGAAGELCVSGASVARGYLNQPELTARKFLFNRSYWSYKSYIYRTGDMARWTSRGALEFLGRIDTQVKIRGYRIEPGEIESRLLTHEAINEAVVIPREQPPADKYLCAYIVLKNPGSINIPALKEYLAVELPDYMIPSFFVELERIPLTPNGKLNRKLLPEPEMGVLAAYYAAPGDPVEKKLAEMWREILEVDRIGIDDNFFQLGGHSLKAIILISGMNKAFHVNVPLAQIFRVPTIRGLSAYIKSKEKGFFTPIEPVEKKDYHVLSSAQKRLYILHRMDEGSTGYNMPYVLKLEGEVNKNKLEEIFLRLIARHESLRTCLRMLAGVPVQRIHDDVEFHLDLYDLQDYHDFLRSFIRPFDLSHPPLLRVALIKKAEKTHLLIVDMHHIISDGISRRLLVQEFMALAAGKDLRPLRLQYKDFSGWQNSEAQKKARIKQKAYWKKQLEGEIPVLDLPTDFVRPTMQRFEGSTVTLAIDREEVKELQSLALAEGITLYMILLAICYILLSKLSNQEDIIVGTPTVGRRHADLQQIIGMFVNTLVLRNYPSGEKTYRGFLNELKKRSLQSFENQDYPYEELVEELSITRDASRNPLFDIMFVMQNIGIPGIEIPGLKLAPYEHQIETSKFDLAMIGMELEEKLSLTFEYSTNLFKKATIERFIAYFKKIVSTAAANPDVKIRDVEILLEEEKKQVLYDFNNTTADYPKDKVLHRLFEGQVEKTPDNIAAVGPVQIKYMTYISYRELNNKSNRSAYLLQAKGIKPDFIIGIMAARSLEMIVGILAILKAGGVYLPIDPDYPLERKTFMLDDSNAHVLLTSSFLLEGSPFKFKGEIFPLDDMGLYKNKEKDVDGGITPGSVNKAGKPVYIMYTSGSTGRPKGVLVEHRNVVRLVVNTNYVELTAETRILQTGAPVFDATTFEIWGALLNGGQLVLVEKETILDAYRLGQSLKRNKINTLWLTSPLFNQLTAENHEIFSPLDYLLVGGDVLSPGFINLVRNKNRALKIINGYGPTENTTFSTTFSIDGDFDQAIPIGSPIANSTAFILNPYGGFQPIGVFGELWVGGDGVSRGYLNDPELTAERFVELKVKEDIHHRSYRSYTSYIFYKTGDIARWLPDGNIEFSGRMDHQVKIRGFRIELSEIEHNLLKHENITDAIAIADSDENEDKYLCAYIVSDHKLSASQLRNYLSKNLPGYMIPSYFVRLETLPLTPNGKVDRKALPKPDKKELSGDYIAPRNLAEKKLVEVWSEVLGIKKDVISIDSNFFQLGGHSLKATILAAKVYKAFNVSVPLAEIFVTPTIKELAGYIAAAGREIYVSTTAAEEKEYYPLSSAQKRLYVLQQMDRRGTGYNISSVLSVEGDVNGERLENIFIKLIARHESLRTSFEIIAGEPVQKIHEEVDFKVTSPIKAEKIIRNFIRPFDLTQAPLLRVGLIYIKEKKYILMVDMHHIISDGTSMEIFVKEFTALYCSKNLPPLRIRYKDYSEWQLNKKESERIKQQEDFWTGEFAGEIPILELPLDDLRPTIQSFAGRRVRFLLSSQETGALNQWAVENNSTLFMVLLAVFNVLLAKISGQEDIVMGSPIAGRRQADLQRIIGMFVNTLALRNYPAPGKRFVEFLQEVRKKTLTALENQEYPFEDLVDQSVVTRDVSRNPLFDVMLVMGNIGLSRIPRVPGLKLSPYPYETGISKFDLTFYCEEGKEGVVVSVEYCLKLFAEKTVVKIINYFKKVIYDIYNDKHRNIKIRDIEIIGEEERKQILYDYNDTETAYPGDKVIHGFFADQVERTPDHTALIGQNFNAFGGTHLSYRELNKKAGQMAYLLMQKGVKPDTIVGIMIERSIAAIVGIMGILKAGGAYLPIDPNYPRERIDYILNDSNAKIFLKSHSNDQCHPTNCMVSNPGFRASDFSSSNLAYVLYTSGSTGKPRGVLVQHGSVVNILSVLHKKYPLLEEDAYLLKTTYTFDVSVSELFGWFFGGGRLAILEPGGEKDPLVILDWIERIDITHINFVPSMFGVFLEMLNSRDIKQLSRLKYIFLAGETLSPYLIKKFNRFNTGIVVENIYGPTESTIYASQYSLRLWKGVGSIPIGKPLPNIRLYILNPTHQLQPIGLVGELCIGGKGLARGYLNRPGLTAEKFLSRLYRSYRSHMTYIIYKTGDLARWLADGNIEFLGRLDFQVKVRGFRIELGEIENQLLKHSQIKEAVVMLKEDERGDRYLCAYIAAALSRSRETFNVTHLRDYLLNHLPGYMVPSYFMQVDELPLTPSGKIDRKALLRTGLEIPGKYNAPGDELEKNLVEIWSRVLNTAPGDPPSIGIDNNFFELGGHSLKAITMVSQIQTRFHVTVPLARVFKSATIRKLAAYIKTASKEKFISIDPAEKKDYYRLSSAQKRLYILQQMDEEGIVYNLPSVVILEGHVDNSVLADTFKQLVKRHESLRTSVEMIGEEPVQRVHDTVKFEIEYYDLTADKENHKLQNTNYKQITNQKETRTHHSSKNRIIHHSFIRPFDLSQPPLLRVGLIRTREQGRILILDMHHIVSDGISMGIAASELMALYAGESLPPLRLQYKDYSQWQTSEQQISSRKKQEKYWLKEFAGEVPVLELPPDYPRPALQCFVGKTSTFTIPTGKTIILKKIAAKESATLYMLLLAAFNILLAKLSGREDIVVGTVLAGRKHPDLNSIMGMFVNTLALRNFPRADQSFDNFLKKVKERTLEAFENQEYGFEELVEKLEVKRDASRNPQFDVVFAMVNQNIESIAKESTGLKLKPHPYKSRISKFDLSLFGIETGENQLSFIFEYSTKLFKPGTIERFTRYFKRIISHLVENPGMTIAHMDIITEEEKNRILVQYNDTEALYHKDKTIHRLFEEQVERAPHHIALLGMINPKSEIRNPKQIQMTKIQNSKQEGTKGPAHLTVPISITYKELNEKSDRCAHWLMAKGVRADTIVGIMVQRSVEMVVGILGILKAGGAYLPIDPDYPVERITYMLKDSNARILLKDGTVELKESNICTVLDFEHLNFEFVSNFEFRASDLSPSNLSYVIYTSGTTGRPKGTLIPHRNVVRLMCSDKFQFDFNDRDVWTLFHSCCFDFSVWEMYGALLYGGRLIVIPKIVAKDTGAFLEILVKEKVTVLNQVPSAFYNLASEELNQPNGKLKLKYIIFGGEALKPLKLKELKQKYPGTKFINMFGITETTVHVTYKKIENVEIELNSSNIGKPIPTLRTYVMDRHLQLQAPGLPGELLVGGEGVAGGYLNRVELTGEKFVDNPYKPGERLYKSGDLVKLTDTGEMEYLGRMDQQVQVRGFRIELGEIENQLLNFTPVKEAVVIDRQDSSGDIQLAAYIVPDPRYAYPIQQLLKLESSGLTTRLQRCTWPNGMIVFYINRNETEFMYREIFEEQSYLKHGIRLHDKACIFDVGANIGVFSLFVHQVCKDAVIYSFEPIPRVFQLLTLNTSLYGANVKLFQCGLSSKEEEAVFTYYPHNTVLSGRFADKQQEIKTVGAFLQNQPGQPRPHQVRELLEDRLAAYQLKCPMKTLSEIIEEHGIQCIDLLKIDVEKSEQAVLAGIDEQHWPKIRQLAIEVHNIDGRLDTIVRLLETHGYRVVVEQEPILKNTDLYNIYAVIPGQAPAGNEAKQYLQCRWADPERLKNQARDFLKKKLPEYMIPNLFGLLQTIPLTSNNKVDGKALPDIISSGTAGPYRAPADEIEKKLVEIWSGILGIENHLIGIDSDFFQLGGHSLKATIMVSRIHKGFHVKVPLAEVFKTSTIKELAGYIRERAKSPFTIIEPVEKKDYYALSSAQKRLYVLQQMETGSPVYTIPAALILEGDVDKDKLEAVFRGLIKRHESLRTSFIMVGEEPVQRVRDTVKFEMEYYDLTIIRPLDLSRAPLLRVGLIRIDQSEHMLVINVHHIISDGISLAIITREFTELYAGENIPGLRLQFKDYSTWQNRNRKRKGLLKQQEYWLGQFEGEIPVLKLPIDYPRPGVQRFEGSTLKFVIPPRQAGGLKNLAAVTRTTLFMVLLAIYNILLSKISGQEDIVVGIPTAGRRHADLESIVGMFVNTLVVRSFPHHDKTCEEFLLELKQQTLSAFENQDYPFEELVEQLPIHKDAGRNPLFDTMFALSNMEMQSIEIPNVVVKPYQTEGTTSKFDISLNCLESAEGFVFTIEYCTKLFKKATVNRFISGFKQVLSAVLENPQKKIAHIEIITGNEKRQILETFNHPPGEYPQKTVMKLFKEQVKQAPARIAGFDNGSYLTFAELAERINVLTKVIEEL